MIITNKRDYKSFCAIDGTLFDLYRSEGGGYWNVHVNNNLRAEAEIYPIKKHGCSWRLVPGPSCDMKAEPLGHNLKAVLLQWQYNRLARQIHDLERGDNFAYTQNPHFKKLMDDRRKIGIAMREV